MTATSMSARILARGAKEGPIGLGLGFVGCYNGLISAPQTAWVRYLPDGLTWTHDGYCSVWKDIGFRGGKRSRMSLKAGILLLGKV